MPVPRRKWLRAGRKQKRGIEFQVMKATAKTISTVIILVFCSGCGTFISGFNSNPNRVYGGVRQDVRATGDGYAYMIIDAPFSFVADTLLLPFDLYRLSEMPPSVDPLKGWNSWTSWDEEPHPAIYGGPQHILVNPAQPVKHSPLDKTVTDDYQSFIQKLKFQHGPESEDFGVYGGSIVFFEDRTGQHAVKIVIPCNNLDDSVTYILIYDKSDIRRKVIKYKYFKPPSFG